MDSKGPCMDSEGPCMDSNRLCMFSENLPGRASWNMQKPIVKWQNLPGRQAGPWKAWGDPSLALFWLGLALSWPGLAVFWPGLGIWRGQATPYSQDRPYKRQARPHHNRAKPSYFLGEHCGPTCVLTGQDARDPARTHGCRASWLVMKYGTPIWPCTKHLA